MENLYFSKINQLFKVHLRPLSTIFQLSIKYLTVINILHLIDNQQVIEKLQNSNKKKIKNRTTYQKNAYLCNVLINK